MNWEKAHSRSCWSLLFGLQSKAGAMLPAPVYNAPPCTSTSFHCHMKGKISSCPVPKLKDVCLERWVPQEKRHEVQEMG